MNYFFNLKNNVALLAAAILLACCTSKRDQVKILLYSEKSNQAFEQQVQDVAARSGWSVEKVSDTHLLEEDFVRQFSSILMTFSSISQLDHKAVATMKRYFESGGGGLVLLKDTIHAQTGWPWLSLWNEKEPGRRLKQDNGRVSILSPAFSSEDFTSAVRYTVGDNRLPDYGQAKSLAVPDSSRYTYRVLAQGMDEPMQMAILPNHNVLIAERKGAVKLFNDSSKQTKTIAQFDVFSGIEDGLLGVALDPDFDSNNWVYFYYAVAGDRNINRLSRMKFCGEELRTSTENTLLEIPTQRIYCCHSAGYISFGPDGLLYLSTGDNTNAEETEGYVPIDERPGRELSDDQATAANSNDLRGKILRIKPEPDGTYSIPDGNLFPKDGSQGRPEIYVMGCRNPYRFSIDNKNNFLYWGDVGPDTKVQASEGTLSYDEINQARGPGFYGWPYFLGNNEAFPYYDFATKTEGPKFNPARPLNNSPNNTGVKELPPAQSAMIWYGDGSSARFPLVGKGGQSAMAGPVYYSDLFPSSQYKLSPYYDGKLFIYDWVRRWFMAVTLDENGDFMRMEPFLDHLKFVAPTDMQFASDGALYILEYGTNWFARNADARLIRVEYSEGNRKPVANISVNNLYGAVPFEATFSARGSKDYDEDDVLEYYWQVDGRQIKGEELHHTFSSPGTYEVVLRVKDNHGAESMSTVRVKAGNAPPVIDITTTANRTFYWDDMPFTYKVQIRDQEDARIDPDRVNISLDFLARGKDLAVILTNPRASGNIKFVRGQNLIDGLDCRACHSVDQESVGPAYKKIAERYAAMANVSEQLVNKIIEGGSGNWGQRPMSSHPDLSVADAKEIVAYILSLSNSHQSLPLRNTLHLKEHAGQGNEGSYLLLASYTDKGANGIEPLYTQNHIALRHPLVQIEDFDEGNVRLGTITTEFLTFATAIKHESFVKFSDFDLSQVKYLKYRILSQAGGNIEVRIDSRQGELVSNLNIPAHAGDRKAGWQEVRAIMDERVAGTHDVYFVFTNPMAGKQNLFNIDWIYFDNKH